MSGVWQDIRMNELRISNNIVLSLNEIELSAIRSQGAGGQHVNKTSTGIHLRFDIRASSLPEETKARLLAKADHRISKDGILIIKSQQSRSQEQNRLNALSALQHLIQAALVTEKPRKKTRPTRSSKEKRLQQKSKRGQTKSLRRKISDD